MVHRATSTLLIEARQPQGASSGCHFGSPDTTRRQGAAGLLLVFLARQSRSYPEPSRLTFRAGHSRRAHLAKSAPAAAREGCSGNNGLVPAYLTSISGCLTLPLEQE